MKLFGKMTLMSLAVLLVGSLGFMSTMLVGGTVHGDSSVNAPVITLTEYTPTYKYNETTKVPGGSDKDMGYLLPKASVPAGSTIDQNTGVKARMSNGTYAKVMYGTDGNWYLITDKTGKFDIIYTAINGDYKTVTKGVSVEITATGVTLDLGTNVKQIIPTIAYAGNKIIFPRAKVMVDGEENADLANSVTIELKNSSGETKATFNQSTAGFMEYTVADSDSGDFEVIYTYAEGGKTVRKVEKFRVNTTEQEVELKYSNNLSSSLQNLSLEVGVEATLPTPTVVNSKANDADVSSKTYTEVTVKLVGSNKAEDTKVITDYKFTPWTEGSYRITYVTKDFFGNECSVSVQRDKIKLTANSITVKPVKVYDPEGASFDYSKLDLSDSEWASHDYEIASVLYLGDGENSKVTGNFPAIIAKGGWGNYSNLKFTRTIWKNGNTIGTLESAHSVGGDTSATYKAYQVGQYDFSDEGSYEIVYSAMYLDDEGNEISGTRKTLSSYKFEVKKGTKPTSASDTNLTITAPSISSTAVLKNADKTIKFDAPSVSDDDDTRLQVEVTYKFNGHDKPFHAKLNSDGTYEIKVERPTAFTNEQWEGVTTMTITFKVKNDNGYDKEDTKVISLLDFSKDKAAPTIEENGEASYNSSTKKITLPTTKFVDATENATNVSLVVYVMVNDKVVDILNGSSNVANHSAVLNGYEYEPTQEGVYTFVYVATDQNMNTTTFSTSCEVEFQTGYSVSISSISTKEYGDILDLTSVISVTKNGKVINIDNSKVAISSNVTELDVAAMANDSMLIQVTGAYQIDQTGANGRIKCLEGDIYVKAWVKDSSNVCDFDNNASSVVSFKSADTIAPEFTIEGEKTGTNVIATYEFADNDEGNTHVLPWFDEITDAGAGVSLSSLKVEMTYTTSSNTFKTFTVADLDSEEGLKYTVTQQGKIKVVYSAADEIKGNTTTREFWIYVGDVIAPEIVVANDAITAPTKVGETCTISLDSITFKNDESLSKTDDLKVSVKLNGSDVDWEYDDNKKNITFKASEAGNYVITFNVADKVGNEATTVTKTITVKSESVTKANTSTVWGTIMIIVALVVVGVVIFFFVKPSRTRTKAGNSKKIK